MEMKEFRMGELFIHNNEVIQCLRSIEENGGCGECCFGKNRKECSNLMCYEGDRKDSTSVTFKRIDFLHYK